MWRYDIEPEQQPKQAALPLEISHVCWVDNLPKWNYPWHNHVDCYELVFVENGQGILHIDDENVGLPIAGGNVTLMPPQRYHYYSARPDATMAYFGIYFKVPAENVELRQKMDALGVCVGSGTREMPFFRSAILAMAERVRKNEPGTRDAVQAIGTAVAQLAVTLFKEPAVMPQQPENDTLGTQVMRYIGEHYTEQITLQSIATHFAVSPSHLNRIFQETYHTSPINYLIYNRITGAVQNIMATDWSVEAIAESVGYTNVKHFINLFVDRIGCTPAEYRRQYLAALKSEDALPEPH